MSPRLSMTPLLPLVIRVTCLPQLRLNDDPHLLDRSWAFSGCFCFDSYEVLHGREAYMKMDITTGLYHLS
jgi:hypothetical protein